MTEQQPDVQPEDDTPDHAVTIHVPSEFVDPDDDPEPDSESEPSSDDTDAPPDTPSTDDPEQPEADLSSEDDHG